MRTQRIVVETYPNTRVREFTSTKLVSQSDERFYRPLNKRSKEYLKKVGNPGAKIIRKVMRISGVIDIATDSYTIRVIISKAHEWIDIENQILKIISEEVFNKQPDQIEIRNRNIYDL